MIRKAARAAVFAVLVASLYVVALSVAAKVRYGEYSLLQILTGHYAAPGGRYQSLRRFREADGRGKVDIAFFGSSHAYRGFDPRVFSAAGFESMNLGSMNQTPLNTYRLAQRYLPKLAPDLVVIEVFYPTVAGDGLESTRDLTTNMQWSVANLRMAVDTWNLGAIAFSTAKALGIGGSVAGVAQSEIPGETYVAGGYCETRARRLAVPAFGDPIAIEVRSEQLDSLERTSALARAHGARVVWVTHPLPSEYKRVVSNLVEVERALERAAQRSQVEYWNFDATMTLDPIEDFADAHHLSAAGVEKFNRALLGRLGEAGYLPRRSPR